MERTSEVEDYFALSKGWSEGSLEWRSAIANPPSLIKDGRLIEIPPFPKLSTPGAGNYEAVIKYFRKYVKNITPEGKRMLEDATGLDLTANTISSIRRGASDPELFVLMFFYWQYRFYNFEIRRNRFEVDNRGLELRPKRGLLKFLFRRFHKWCRLRISWVNSLHRIVIKHGFGGLVAIVWDRRYYLPATSMCLLRMHPTVAYFSVLFAIYQQHADKMYSLGPQIVSLAAAYGVDRPKDNVVLANKMISNNHKINIIDEVVPVMFTSSRICCPLQHLSALLLQAFEGDKMLQLDLEIATNCPYKMLDKFKDMDSTLTLGLLPFFYYRIVMMDIENRAGAFRWLWREPSGSNVDVVPDQKMWKSVIKLLFVWCGRDFSWFNQLYKLEISGEYTDVNKSEETAQEGQVDRYRWKGHRVGHLSYVVKLMTKSGKIVCTLKLPPVAMCVCISIVALWFVSNSSISNPIRDAKMRNVP